MKLLVPLLLLTVPVFARPVPAAAAHELAHEAACAVRVERGWARLMTESRVATVRAGGGEQALADDAFCEFGARTRTRVRWSGRASALVDGKAAVGVTPGDAASAGLELYYFGRAELEARRGALRVDLPAGWSTTLAGAVLGLHERADGAIEVEHRGGESLWFERTDAEGERTRLRLDSGGRLVLGA